jgi:glutathione synthase/RimK-type ligase-like ATP-grasp enzyme
MNDRRCWGIYREQEFSLHRIQDDAEILRATARELESRGFSVSLKTPAEAGAARDRDVPPYLFGMCQSPDLLARLRRLEEQGAVVVNSPAAVLRTHRVPMLEGLARRGIPFPESVVVGTAAAVLNGTFPCWVKRGDFHRTEEADVSLAEDRQTAAGLLAWMAERGIVRAVLQHDVPGDLIKLYGVAPGAAGGPGSWFTWFYHREQNLSNHPFDEAELARLAAGAADAIGLEVFGGDAIATADGRLYVIDVNAWPSFALYRGIASARIAEYLAARFRREVAVER